MRGWAFLDPEAVLEKARELDARLIKRPLHGVPVAVKDVVLTEDMPTQRQHRRLSGSHALQFEN